MSGMHASFGQGDAHMRQPRFTVSEVYLGFGSFVHPNMSLTTGEWRTMLPGSSLLQRDLPRGLLHGGAPSWLFDNGGYDVGMAHLGLALELSPREGRYAKLLRMGVVHAGHGGSWSTWSRYAVGRYDTLTSATTGQVIFVDTVWSERYEAMYEQERLGLEVSFVLRKRTPGRWDWQVGAGVMAGVAINGTAAVWRTEERRVDPYLGSGYSGSVNRHEVTDREEFRIGGGAWASAYGLLGLGFQLGREHPFWSGLQLRYEIRPSLLFAGVPGVRSATLTAGQHLFGIVLRL